MKKILIGAACDLGIHIDGSSLACDHLIQNGFKEFPIFRQDSNYKKEKDRNIKHKNYTELYNYIFKLYKFILNYNRENSICLIGGDHSVAIASALASRKRNGDIGMIWIDAHSDYHTLLSTTSGNLHGIPCACINGLEEKFTSFYDDEYIKPDKTVIFGARSIDGGEYANLAKSGVRVITMGEIKTRGIDICLDEAYKIANSGSDGIHISFDLDFFDPSFIDAVSTPVLNGGSEDDLKVILNSFTKYKDNIVSFDLVEYNPLFDKEGETLDVINRIIALFMSL